MKNNLQKFVSARLWQHLEARTLFDAAPEAEMVQEQGEAAQNSEPEIAIVATQDSASTSSDDQNSESSVAADGVSRELVIIDTSVEDYQQLIDDLLGNEDPNRDFQVITIDADEDGIARLTEILSGQNDLDALHIISHGEDGAFRLGNTWVNDTSLQANAGAIAGWGDALNDTGDILLYGCDVTGNDAGEELVENLAALTQQQVAASDDDTGAESRGGDYVFEYHVGLIQTDVAFSESLQASYRHVLAAGPEVSIAADQDVMLGEDFNFNVTFDNTGSDPGFGPYIDLIFPTGGADGDDGIDFSGATYLGQSLTTYEYTFGDDGGGTETINHPYFVDNTGTPLQVTGATGDTLVVIELPFGSVTPGQPDIAVTVTGSMSADADLGTPLTIQSRSGFRYGEDAADNPVSDPSIVSDTTSDVSVPATGWTETMDVTPTLMTLQKQYVGPENETATGPNHNRQYRISVDIADGQTISNLDIIDSLPNNIIVTGISSVMVDGAAATYSDNLASLTQPGNAQDLTVTLTDAVTGTGSASDVVVTIDFYVPELDANGDRIIPINGEDDTTSNPDSRSFNNASAVGDWTPTDTDDAPGIDNAVADPAGDEHVLDAKSIAIQKSVNVVGGGPVVPGATLEYVLTFQISDYYTYGDLIIDDIFQDGQRFDFGYGATFNLGDFSNSAAGNFTVRSIGDADAGETLVVDETRIDLADNLSEDPVSNGETTLRFDVSQAFIDQLTTDGASNVDGILQGGLSNGATNLGAATGTIRFRTTIQDDYADTFDSGDRSVDQGDTITNDQLTISGTVRQNEEDGSISNVLLANEEDGSAASVQIETGTLNKEVYAINGNTTLPIGDNGLPVLVAGDVVTYRITYTLPTSDFEDLQISDFFPLPILSVADHDADGVTGDTWTIDFSNTTLDAVSGTIELGANDDFFAESGITPTVDVSAADNRLSLIYGDYDDPASDSNTIELYINVTAQDEPTADGLYLTNTARATEGTTQLESTSIDDIVQIEVTQPVLDITKGLVGSFETLPQINELSSAAGFTGNYTITVGGETTAAIAATANATTIRNAIAALPSIGAGNVTVTGGPLSVDGNPSDSPVVIQFVGALEGISAGAISTNRAEISAEETSVAVTFNDVGDASGNGLFTGRITSTGITEAPINENLIDLDAGDQVRYAIVIENTGNSARGAFDVTLRDLLPDNVTVIGGSLQIVDGTGAAISYTKVDGSAATQADLFDTGVGGGIKLVDPSATQGSIAQYDASTGDNVVILFYDAILDSDLPAGSTQTNTATLTNYAGREAGEDHTPTDLNDTATISVLQPTIAKTLEDTEIDNPNNDDTQVVIGEYVDYEIVVTVPEGEMTNFEVLDTLDAGMAYVNGSAVITASAGLSTSETSFANVASSASVNGSGNQVTFDFGTLTNANTDNATTETITITLRAIVTNVASNDTTTDELNNTATLSYDSGPDRSNSTADVTVLEPSMTVSVTADVGVADVGNPIEYTITVTNVAGATGTDAYDVDLVDVIPTGLTYVGGSLSHDSGVTPTSFGESGGTITANWSTFAEGGTSTFTFQATANSSMTTAGVTNDADITWTSLPGDETTARSTHSAVSTERTGDDSDPGSTENDYAANDDAFVDFPITPTKTIVSTSESHTGDATADTAGDPRTLAIGELVTFELRTVVGEGNLSDVFFRDLMTQGLILQPATVTFEIISDTNMTVDAALAGANSGAITLPAGRIAISGTTTQTINFDLGDIVNNDNDAGAEELVITYQALVANDATNNDGDAKSNQFQFVENSTVHATSGTINAEIVEPQITNVNKQVVTTNADGTAVTYEVTFANTGSTSAFDVELLDGLATGLTLQTGTISVVNTGTINGIDTSNSSATGLDIRLSEMQAGATITVTYTTTVAYGLTPIQNDADVTYTSLPGGQGTASATPGASGNANGERNGNGTGANDYVDADSAFLGSIGDRVWHDVDGNGSFNGQDQAIAGVGVTMRWFGEDGIEGNGDDVVRTDTTDSNGNYEFAAVPAGEYRITVNSATLPNGLTTPTHDLDGTGTAHNTRVTLTDSIAGIVESSADFGYRGSGSIGDRIFYDYDNGGTRNNGEPYIEGVDVVLTWGGFDGVIGTGGDDLVFTRTTNASGLYDFTNLPAGTFVVDVTESTIDFNGDAVGDSVTLTTSNEPHNVSLSTGQDYNAADFGYVGQGSIGDRIFYDINGDGVQNGQDTGYVGLVVTLQMDFDDDGTVDYTVTDTTDQNGDYRFDRLPPGAYTVTVTTPTGASYSLDPEGTDDGVAEVDLSDTEVNLSQDFALTGTGSIGDRVWLDLDGNGSQNGQEPGIEGQIIRLDIDLNRDGTIDTTRTTTTDSSGSYSFGNLPAGDYDITVTNPLSGANPTADFDGTGSAHTSAITLDAVTTSSNAQDFGYQGTGSIGQLVYWDVDGDGSKDTNEVGLAGTVVELEIDFDGDGDYDATITDTVDAAGNYSFGNLPALNYRITTNPATGTVQTQDPDSTFDDISTVTLAAGENNTAQTFGYRGNSSISDQIYYDVNNNSAFNSGVDRGLEGVEVTISINTDGIAGVDYTQTVTTNSAGTYLFDNLIAGTYVIDVNPATIPGGMAANPTADPDGTVTANTATLPLPINTDNTAQDFGYRGTGQIGDLVYWDANNNGSFDSGTEIGLEGLTVTLGVDLDSNGSIDETFTTVTDANGNYSFNNLPAADFVVTVTPQAGTTPTDNLDATIDNTTSLTLTSGQVRSDVDFGYAGNSSIGDLVFFDYVGDGGAFNAGENDRGMSGVDVTIEIDVDGDTTIDYTATTTTNASGNYLFDHLIAGDYTITVDNSDLPDQMGDNPTYNSDGVINDVTSVTLPINTDNLAIDFGYHAVPDYNIVIDDGQLVAETGESLVYTVTMRNDGTLRGNNAVVTVSFPTNLLESVAANSGGIVDAVNGTITWNATTTPALSVMNVGEEVVFTINADVVDPVDGSYQPITLTSAVTDDLVNGVDPDMTDNTDDDVDQIPEIGVAKRLVSSTAGSTGGNRNLTYELVVRNLGSVNLTDLTLLEDLDTQFGLAFQGVVIDPAITASTSLSDPTFASGPSAWNGDTNTDMFDGVSGELRPGDEFTIRFTVEVDIDQLSAGSSNQVTIEGDFDVPDPDALVANSTGTVDDLSDTGTDPLGTNPGVPGDSGGSNDPTLVPAIGIAKDHGDYTEVLDANGFPTGQFVFPTTLVIENLGATDLDNLNLRDDIASIYGDAFVSVANLVVTPVVSGGTAPTANSGWLTDTSQNLLASGSLDPGDSFTVSFDVTLNPDANGGSGYFNNQAAITGSDPTNPTAVVQDFSDSGSDPSTTNTGEPGDFGTADDPTPVAIPDIGLAKRITDVVQKGLTFELTIEMVLANTGTVDLENIELRDDVADQYGANFGRMIGDPIIITSTATMDPTVNTGYSSDTSQAIFDGTDGFLKPGESITIRMVVEVVSEAGQTEVTVINQATTSADPLDENGSPLEDNSGTPIGRINDLSDSGADATGRNPGQPGDLGTWDDPTPQPLTFFTFDAYNDFSQGKKGLEQDSKRDSSEPFDDGVSIIPDLFRTRQFLTNEITSLAPEPIFSGSARPGTQIVGRVYDSAGRLIGEELSFADVGGNWMMQFHQIGSSNHARIEFVEVPGSAETFEAGGDVYGYLGMDNLDNDYASLEPWTKFDQSHEFTAIYRPTVQQSLLGEHQKATRPLGLGR